MSKEKRATKSNSKKNPKIVTKLVKTTINLSDSKFFSPNHKELVLAELDNGLIVLAIYYNNGSFKGFYKFTTFYQNENLKTPYSKTKLKDKHKIENVVAWKLFPTKIK